MYKLVFLILTLSGFLFYKAFTLKAAAKAGLKSSKPSLIAKKEDANNKVPVDLKSKASFHPDPTGRPSAAGSLSDPSANVALPQAVNQAAVPEDARREDFDTLKDVFEQSEEVKEEHLTQQERETHEQTVNLIKKIEAEAAAKKNLRQGKTKTPEELTPEERKQFEIYDTIEKKEDK